MAGKDLVLTEELALEPAMLEFQRLPRHLRHDEHMIHQPSVRFYLNKYYEHREAHDFVQEMQRIPGHKGTKGYVKAFLHFRDTVWQPLEEARSKGRRPARDILYASRRPFTPIPEDDRTFGGGRITEARQMSVRFYPNKWVEHRQAFEFLHEIQEVPGEGNRIMILAFLHYRDTVIRPLQERHKKLRKARKPKQLELTAV